MAAGRPTKYTPAFLKKEAVALRKFASDTAIPFLKEFSSKRGYSAQRISDFAEKSDDFKAALEYQKDIFESKLVKLALFNKINSTFAIFTMKNCCGWRDVRDMNHMSDGDFEMTITTHSPRRKASKNGHKTTTHTKRKLVQ